MSPPNPVLIWALALVALALGVRGRRGRRPAKADRLPAIVRIGARLPMPSGLVGRAAGPRLVENVVAAGFSRPSAQDRVARARVGWAGAGLLCGALVTLTHPVGLAVGAAGAALGYLLPAHAVAREAKRRRIGVVHQLPDMIDLVVICTESGMALEPSMRLAAQRLPGPLAEEVATTVRELDLGTPRREAYAALASRMRVAELTGLVGALLQAEELGAPIADVLRRQAALLRSARTQDIREHAARAAPRVQLVIAMVMVPAALLVVLGLLAIQLIGQIGGVVGGVS